MKRWCSDLCLAGISTGRGDYSVNNTIKTGDATDIIPRFSLDSNSIQISNVEYVKDIYAPASNAVPFTVQTIPLNPGLPAAFPWLSQLAANYQEYELVQCIYTYKTTVQSYAISTGQVGQIMMATQYNPTAEPFADKETMMMYDGAASCKTTSSMLHGVECDPMKLSATTGRKFIRIGSLASNVDQKEYDQGTLNIAVLNPPPNFLGQVMGELWVSYTVVLRKPRLSSLNGNNIPSDIFTYFNQAGTTLLGTSSFPDSLQLSGAKNSFGATFTSVQGLSFTPTQPSATYVNGVPNVGSTLDPVDILANEAPLNPYPWAAGEVSFINGIPIGTFDPTSGVLPVPWQTPGILYAIFHCHYCLTLPDFFQGVCEVTYKQYGYYTPGNEELTNTVQPIGAGNVYRFADIPERIASGTSYGIRYSAVVRQNTQTVASAWQPQDFNNFAITCTAHLRVLPATNGVRNRVYFGCLQNTGVPSSWVPVITECQVKVYNATNSQTLTGKADRLQLQYTSSGLPYSVI
jgi:hypothetical protein